MYDVVRQCTIDFAVLFRTFGGGRLNIVRQKEGDANSLQSVTILKKKEEKETGIKSLCCYYLTIGR